MAKRQFLATDLDRPGRKTERAGSPGSEVSAGRRTAPVPERAAGLPAEGRRRVIIQNVSPEVDGGRFPIKRTIGEEVRVTADIFVDGHDVLSARLKYRHRDDPAWSESPLTPGVNDRWTGAFTPTRLGTYCYCLEAWVNHFGSWRRDLEKKFEARLDVSVELAAGRHLLETALVLAVGEEQAELVAAVEALAPGSSLPQAAQVSTALSQRIAELVEAWLPRLHVSRSRELRVQVDPLLARFSAWYELFPRSCAPRPGDHGTLRDCAAWLPRIAEMGFDIVYLPPIHPIGRSFRKGKNNRSEVGPKDPGSPWAIGADEGGHKAIHPELGTLEDFRALVEEARRLKLELALDIAFQCSPDHPYVREHPQWFKHRPDGSIQYAENPPKKYQDIYPLDFETEDWQGLWLELQNVFEFWIAQGVRVFRVDNPHTKPFAFWEWCLGNLNRAYTGLIFLAEAFTRPKVMYYLAKLGFTQSYNYFPWRNTRHELVEYFTELTRSPLRDFFRPNLWPNTPDILTEYLQYGGRPAFVSRLILAATLGASYGIYGPPFELGEQNPREPGSEEYLDSEKYEIRSWDLAAAGGMKELLGRVNRIRRENPALQSNDTLRFHATDNEQLIAYTKHTGDFQNLVLTVVNLDPRHTQRGWVSLALEDWGLPPTGTYQVDELLTGEKYLWSGAHNFVELNPQFVPAHVFRLRRLVRTERDFDYFL